MDYRLSIRLLLMLALFLVGCGGKTLVVLVPDPDGTTGRVTVSNSAGQVEIDTANRATTIAGSQTAPAEPVEMTNEQIAATFSETLAIQPQPPAHFILYFEKGSTVLKDESRRMLPEILTAIRERSATHISVIGHSDSAGSVEYNLKLSRKRADAVGSLLVERGVESDHILTTSHGEENPLVQTPDDVSEPRNRRVEVVVR